MEMFLSAKLIIIVVSLAALGNAATVLKPIKICPMYMCIESVCNSGFRVDANGCRTCLCNDPCENYVCGDGEVCKSVKVTCVKAPCYRVAKCVPACPLIKCSTICESGYRKDINGCQTCQCIDPCEGYQCQVGEVCEAVDVVCKAAPCYKVAQCVPACPQIKCSTQCQSGYQTDFKGCQTCHCVDPCEETKCADGEVCKSVEVQCFVAPCYNVAQCVVDCSQMVRCMRYCESGYQLDVNGCETCTCLDPCEGVICEEGQVCKAVDVECFAAPCYPVGECSFECPLIKCSTQCQSGFRKDENGCQTCNCIDPCEETICDVGEVCQSLPTPCLPPPSPCYEAAVCTKATECPMLKCIPCESGYLLDENSCQTCMCQDRCERVTCPTGKVCKEVQIFCIRAPCYNQYECVAP